MTAIDCLIFDIDDTLYPITNGFTNHRLKEVAIDFMRAKLGFADAEVAAELWREYFGQYHSTVKALTMAEKDGKLPQHFEPKDFSDFLEEGCHFEKYLQPDPLVASALAELRDAGLKLVIFTNAPRRYGVKVLDRTTRHTAACPGLSRRPNPEMDSCRGSVAWCSRR